MHHDRVQSSLVSDLLELPILGDLSKSHEHVLPRDTDFIESSPAIVITIEAELRADVSSSDPSHPLMSLEVPQLDHKCLVPMVLPIYY